MKKIILISVFVLGLIAAKAQINIAEAQLFGSSRGIGVATVYATFDAKQITDETITHSFSITNNDPYDLTIVSVSLPEGVSVLVPQEIIPAGEKSDIIATVFKKYLSANEFEKYITVNTVETSLTENVNIQKSFTFKLTGDFSE